MVDRYVAVRGTRKVELEIPRDATHAVFYSGEFEATQLPLKKRAKVLQNEEWEDEQGISVDPKKVKFSEDHFRLLKAANWDWLFFETGAPGIDPKRPYGNSNVEEDIAHILGLKPTYDRDGEMREGEKIFRKHRELQYFIQSLVKKITVTQAEKILGQRLSPGLCKSKKGKGRGASRRG